MDLQKFLELPAKDAFMLAGEKLKKKEWSSQQFSKVMREWKENNDQQKLEDLEKNIEEVMK